MVSNLETALTTLSDVLESLAPASDPSGSFFNAETVRDPDGYGTALHRGFWFDASTINFEDVLTSDCIEMVETSVTLNIGYHHSLGTRQARRSAARQDALQVMRKIVAMRWSKGVLQVIVDGSTPIVEDPESNDMVIGINLRVVHDERAEVPLVVLSLDEFNSLSG